MKKVLYFLLLCMIPLVAQEKMDISISYYEDKTKNFKIQDIVDNQALHFSPLNNQNSNFAYTQSIFWLKIKLKNNSKQNLKKILHFLDTRLDRIDLYTQKGKLLVSMGDMLPFANRTHKNAQVAITLNLLPLESKSLFIKAQNKGYINLSHKLWEWDAYIERGNNKKVFYLIYFSSAFIMLIYNFFIYLFIREKAFLDYVLFHIILIIIMFYYSGLVSEFYRPLESGINGGNVPLFLISLAGFLLLKLMNSYLELRHTSCKIYKYSVYLMYINVFVIFFSLTDVSYAIRFYIMSLVLIIEIFYTYWSVGYHVFILKSKVAQFFLFSWLLFLTGVILTILANLGILDRTNFTSTLVQIGSYIEFALLSVGLAYRYKVQHSNLQKKDDDLKAINKNLALIVEQRTDSLEKKVIQTSQLLKDKEILFKELHHRVKNNLQMVVSLLSMQAWQIKDPKYKSIFDETQQRIQSMSLLHESLQNSESLDKIFMKNYLNTLFTYLKNSYQYEGLSIQLNCDDVMLSIQKATSLGLIINELVSNSIKHAFKDIDNPLITITLHSKDSQGLELIYNDNGCGDSNNTHEVSLGSLLIEQLVNKQLKGTLMENYNNGYNCKISFSEVN